MAFGQFFKNVCLEILNPCNAFYEYSFKWVSKRSLFLPYFFLAYYLLIWAFQDPSVKGSHINSHYRTEWGLYQFSSFPL